MSIKENKKKTGYPHIDKQWMQYYDENQTKSEKVNSNTNLFDYIEEKNKDNMNKTALTYYRDHITYDEFFDKGKFEDIKNDIDIYNTIIFAMPTYLDIVPSKLIEFIEKYNINFKNKNIYLICNCGFMESYHNNLTIRFMKNYISSNNGNFKGFFNIGAGEVIKLTKSTKILKLICISFYIKLHKFKRAILNKKDISLKTSVNFLTKKMYCNICNHFWRKKLN